MPEHQPRPTGRLSPQMPEIGALELLLSVARLGSLGRAAREHGITQPAAGSRIRRLEGLLGLSLIERSGLGSRLTAEGAVVADWAKRVVSAAVALDTGVAALRARHEGRLRLAASLTIAEYLIPHWLTELHARRPDTAVALSVANSTEVVRLVLADEVELGFIEGPDLPTGLQHRLVGTDHLQVVVAPGHRWARRRRPLTATELAATPLVHREPGSGTRDTLETVLVPYADIASPVVELSSTTAIKAAVEEGIAPAVLSSLAVADDIAAGRLVAVPVTDLDLQRSLRVIWPAGRKLTGFLRDVVAVSSLSR